MITGRKLESIYANAIAELKPDNAAIRYFLKQNDPKSVFLFGF